MIGHRQILKARSEGTRPAAIFFDYCMQPPEVRYRWQEAERAIEAGMYPVVTIRPDEIFARHDLRFVVGCHCHVSAPQWTDDYIAFGEALAAAGAMQITMNAFLESSEILTYKNEKWVGINAERIAA